jgi:hypothetical protein
MSKQKGSGDDIWPESSQTFGYVRARKRHIVHMDGFIERTKAESTTGMFRTGVLNLFFFALALMVTPIERFIDFDKSILVKFACRGLFLGLRLHSLALLPKNDDCFKSRQKRLKSNFLRYLL